MDIFLERLVPKKKTPVDLVITLGIILMTVFLAYLSLTLVVLAQLGISLFVAAGIIYLGYRLLTARNVEYEYIVTNGDLDIDMIISKKKRKRIFSSSCKVFDIVAPVKSSSYTQEVQSIKNKINATGSIDSPDAYFATLTYNNSKTVVLFEPDERMLKNFKIYIPRKVLNG